MDSVDMGWVIASIAHQRVYDFYGSEDAAKDHLNYANLCRGNIFSVMTWDQYWKGVSEHNLSLPAEEITKEEFIQQLEILPPLHYEYKSDFESFLFSEPTDVPFAYQYFRRGSTYYRKLVNMTNRKTWVRA